MIESADVEVDPKTFEPFIIFKGRLPVEELNKAAAAGLTDEEIYMILGQQLFGEIKYHLEQPVAAPGVTPTKTKMPTF